MVMAKFYHDILASGCMSFTFRKLSPASLIPHLGKDVSVSDWLSNQFHRLLNIELYIGHGKVFPKLNVIF